MKTVYRGYLLSIGIVVKVLNLCVPVKKNCWIFGAFHGEDFREGSKFLLEYVYEKHSEIDATFITQNRETLKKVRSLGYKCYLNTSILGLLKTLRAECVFTTQDMAADILFISPKKKRRIFYLVHGQPLKKALSSLPDGYEEKLCRNRNSIMNLLKNVYIYFCLCIKAKDLDFVSATSNFLKPFMELDFGHQCEVKILGMPRIDAFFNENKINNEKWHDKALNKFVITYMPTHRKYGAGEVSPFLFEGNAMINDWFKTNNIVLLIKNHPNMIPKVLDCDNMSNIIDITKEDFDAQVILYHTDLLITDFSSVWIDYLILRRPIIYFLYDDFEHEDVGCHYDIRTDPAGQICNREDDLFSLIKRIFANYDEMRPPKRLIDKFHNNQDGKSCERYFKEVLKPNYHNTKK